ncbi:MAG: hypothetical protein WAM98_18780 [Terriglobales bacterium]
MRDDTGGKYQPHFLRCGINRSQQATPCDPSPARLRINHDVPHSRQINHQAAIAGAKTCQAMPSTTNGGKNSNLRSGSDCALHIAYIRAAGNQSWRASGQAIPNGTRVFVAAIAWAEQITFESPVERRVNFFAGFDHLVHSLPNAGA